VIGDPRQGRLEKGAITTPPLLVIRASLAVLLCLHEIVNKDKGLQVDKNAKEVATFKI
jgi:hypothetical protein